MSGLLVRGRVDVGEAVGVGQVPGTRGTAVAQGEESGGEIEARLEPVPQNKVWLIERIVVQCTSSVATDAKIYAGDANPINLVDATPGGGNLNVADQFNPVRLDPGQRLTCVWDNTPDGGSIGTIRVQYIEASYVYASVGGR